MTELPTPSLDAYNASADGTLGWFASPSGRVAFIQSRARLRAGDTSRPGRLTSFLTPVREALDVREMDFNQLLQRDLDDHRIAHELVPYLLENSKKVVGPAFFPPIVAALLPFRNKKPVDHFPAIALSDGEDTEFKGSNWQMYESDGVFRLQVLVDGQSKPSATGYSVLRWHEEKARLVIMDGQHRAMALLAIHRTLSNSWGSGGAASARYKGFYETRIRSLISDSNPALDQLEFPVTICIFVDDTGDTRSPHKAARKLFVDVNKEARQPSESRLILLSDVRLDHILSREMLNHMRAGTGSLPIFAVEYDNPEPRTTTPTRWSAVTNLEILLKCVDLCCFGPSEAVKDVARPVTKQGKPKRKAKDIYFRSQIAIKDLFERQIEDGPRILDRNEIGLEHFPQYNKVARERLLSHFWQNWGSGICRLISEIEPYRAHIAALCSIKEGWGPTASDDSALAREALFEGVGMYWTLERGFAHWRDRVKKAKEEGHNPPDAGDIENAWKIISDATDSKKEAFEDMRAKNYQCARSPEGSSTLYSTMITYAAQVGLILSWALIRARNPRVSPNTLLDLLISSINGALVTGPVESRDRRMIFARNEKIPFNMLGKLDATHATYFRYFWLELFRCGATDKQLEEAGLDIGTLTTDLEDARAYYLRRLVDDRARELLSTKPELDTVQRNEEATRIAVDSLAKAMKHWFGAPVDESRESLTRLLEETRDDESPDDLEDEEGI